MRIANRLIVIAFALLTAAAFVQSPARAAPESPTEAAPTAHASAEGMHGEGGHVETKEGLFPKADAATVAQAVWAIVIFLILVVLLYSTAWKGVLKGLKSREQRIRQDIADAEASRHKAEASFKEYNTRLATAEDRVREIIAKATSDAESIAASIRTRSQQESEEAKERATREIEAAKNQAVAEIYERAADLSVAVAEKILQRNVNADDQRELVRRSLDQLQATANN